LFKNTENCRLQEGTEGPGSTDCNSINQKAKGEEILINLPSKTKLQINTRASTRYV